MKRFSILLAGLVATVTLGTTLGFEGVAAAAKVKSGSTWTTTISGQSGCIPQTFVKVKKVRTWTGLSVFAGTTGPWTGGGKTVSWTLTAGPGMTEVFSGTYSKTLLGYSGTISLGGQTKPAMMMPGLGC